MLECPIKHKRFRLGYAMTEESFHTNEYTDNWTYCPRCKQSHKWSGADVVWVKAHWWSK